MFGVTFVAFLVCATLTLLAMVGPQGVAGLMRGIPGDEKVDIMVGGDRIRCRVLRDRWWYDTIAVNLAATYQFFQTTAGKTRAYQHFEGDRSLVKETEYALVFGMVAYLLVQDHATLPVTTDVVTLFDDSFFDWRQDKVVVDEDRMKVLAGGVSARVSGLAAAAAEAQPGDGRHDNMRIYGKPKLITGGRSVDLFVATGTALPSGAHDLQIGFYGLWLLPEKILGKAPKR